WPEAFGPTKSAVPQGLWMPKTEALLAMATTAVATAQWKWAGIAVASTFWLVKWSPLFAPKWKFECQVVSSGKTEEDVSRLDMLKRIATRDGMVYFSHSADPGSEYFGNFFSCQMTFGKVRYQCAEAAYHAQKVPQELRGRFFSELD